jgi:hypothetical protein
MLNLLDFFRNLPNSTKIFLVFVAIGLAVAGLLNFSDLFSAFNKEKMNELIEVQLLVETAESQPISNVEVRFTTKGAPDTKYTNTSGYAQIKIPSRDDVDITLTKEGYETLTETINLKTDPDRNKKFRLKAKRLNFEQPITYQYYTAQNDFLPLTMSLLAPGFEIPIIKKVLSEQLGITTPPLVSTNPIFETIKNFKIETGNESELNRRKLSSMVHYVSNTNGKTTITDISSAQNGLKSKPQVINETQNIFKKKSAFYSIGEYNDLSYFIFAPVLNPFLTNTEDSKYTSFLEETVLQFPKLKDVGKYAISDDSISSLTFKEFWIKKVIENNPDIRGFIGFDYSYLSTLIPKEKIKSIINAGCGTIYALIRKTPSPYIKFIDIKNTSKTPIRIESIKYKLVDNNPYKLTIVEKRNLLFKDLSDTSEELNIYLEPEKHFLIPIEFGFNTDSYKKDYITLQNFNKEEILKKDSLYIIKPKFDMRNLGENTSSAEITKAMMNRTSLNKDFVQNSSSIESLLKLIPKRFAVGAVLNISSIEVDGHNLNIFPPNNEPPIYISEIFLEGSCPFLMVYNSQDNHWLEMGTVLTDTNQKKLQHEEIHKLDSKISQIRIEERESEITYIDALSILYTDPESHEIYEVAHSLPQLKKADESYFLLHKGEHLDISLKNFIPANATNIKLKINGYYENIAMPNLSMSKT